MGEQNVSSMPLCKVCGIDIHHTYYGQLGFQYEVCLFGHHRKTGVIGEKLSCGCCWQPMWTLDPVKVPA